MGATEAAVLVVEDDEGIGGGLVRVLQGEGYEVVWSRTAVEVLSQPLGRFRLVVLDLGLPDMDGLDLCRQLRRRNCGASILVLTARGTETDIVVGLDAGADDYLVKPFRLAELLARLRAIARRTPGSQDRTTITAGDVTVDVHARRVFLGGQEIALRAKEFDLLTLLVDNAGRVVTRDEAMSHVWDEHWHGSTKTLDVHIAALRQRLGESDSRASRITTLRGVGYRMEHSLVTRDDS